MLCRQPPVLTVYNHGGKPTLLKREVHMVLPQTSPNHTPTMQSFKSYLVCVKHPTDSLIAVQPINMQSIHKQKPDYYFSSFDQCNTFDRKHSKIYECPKCSTQMEPIVLMGCCGILLRLI